MQLLERFLLLRIGGALKMDDHIFSLFQQSTRFNYSAALVQNPAGWCFFFFFNNYILS